MDERLAAIDSAEAFLRASAAPWIADYVKALGDRGRAQAWLAALSDRQDSTGCFAEGLDSDETPFAATLSVLELLDGLGFLDSAAGELTVRYVTGQQNEDGSFGIAGQCEERLVQTGLAAGLLAKSPFTSHRSLRRVSAFLDEQWSEARVREGSLADIDAYFHWLTNYPGELADAALQWCGRELERAYRSRRASPVFTARVFLRCGARALPATQLSIQELASAVIAVQEADGSFRAGHAMGTAAATVMAARVLSAF